MKSANKPIVAICYDFDGTLSPRNMQEFGFFHGLGDKERKTFWKESNGMARRYGADQNLMYMKLMIEKSKLPGNQLKTTRTAFRDYGKDITFFKGVEEWFSRINKFGASRGVIVEHYIISSGLKEMVEGSPIGKQFKKRERRSCLLSQLLQNMQQFVRRDRGRLSVSSNTTILKQSLPSVIA